MSCTRSPFSEEVLISRVQAYPELYDIRHKDHKNQQRRNSIWTEIAAGFVEGYVDAETCAKKWKRCRDSYFRNKRDLMAKSGHAAIKKKPYKFADLLRFLDDHQNRNNTSLEPGPGECLQAVDSETVRDLLEDTSQHSFAFDDQDESEHCPPLSLQPAEAKETRTETDPHSDRPSMLIRQGQFMRIRTSSPASSSRSSSAFSPEYPRRFSHKKRTHEEPPKDAVGEAIAASLAAQNDEDSMFGMTIGTMLKRFPPVIKAKLKLDIMKLLFDADMEIAERK